MLPSQHNPPLQDLETSMGSSLDRDGKGGMRANLPMNGKRITGLAPGVSSTDAATLGQLTGTTSVPVGGVIDYWGATPPEGYLFAAGQEISRSTYADLFAVIGTNAGAGNGSTTFNLPDYRGRIGAGRESMATPATARLNTLSSSNLGATGGAQTVELTEAEMPSHTHELTDPGHTHSAPTSTTLVFGGTDKSVIAQGGVTTTGSSTTGISLANTGGGAAHNNVQPTIICNKIMRVS